MDGANPQAMNEENQTPEVDCNIPSQTSAGRGGRTCCVPNCNNNSRRRPDLSYHKIPQEPTLRKKWTKVLKTKGFCNPGPHNYVCSAHFPGGKKTYENNIPTILSSETHQSTKRRNVSIVSDVATGSDEPELDSLQESDENTIDKQIDSNEGLQEQLQVLQANYDKLQQKYHDDMAKMQQKLFRMERFIGSDHDFRFYTGFPDYATFKVFFGYLTPACNHLIYYGCANDTVVASEEQKKRGKARALSPEQELFMVLVRLRCGILIEDLAHRFDLSSSHVSRIWITWVNFLHQQLRILPIWPTHKFIDENMPECFKTTFPRTRVIIDCTEIYLETPSSCRSQSATFSSYKHNNTAKGLLGISPNGFPSFVSNLYAGRVSDKKITSDCGILKLLEPGDQIMADRGFDIEGNLPAEVTLNIPAFMNGQDQLSKEDEILTRRIASVRVHVERAIARIKSFRIMQQVFPLKSVEHLDKIWTICSYVSLFMPPLINEKQKNCH